MKCRYIYAGLCIILLVATVWWGPTVASATNISGEIPCTLVSNTVSITITDGIVEYGILKLGATENTTASGVSETQTATNTGNETANFKIKSSNAEDVAASDNWTLGAAAGANTFTHEASTDNGVTWDIDMTTAGEYVKLKDNIAADDNQTFDLRIGMPSSVTDYTQHTITVTIQASAP